MSTEIIYVSFFLEATQLNLEIIYTIAVQKVQINFQKKANCKVDLIFKISLDSNFSVWGKVWKNVYRD